MFDNYSFMHSINLLLIDPELFDDHDDDGCSWFGLMFCVERKEWFVCSFGFGWIWRKNCIWAHEKKVLVLGLWFGVKGECVVVVVFGIWSCISHTFQYYGLAVHHQNVLCPIKHP